MRHLLTFLLTFIFISNQALANVSNEKLIKFDLKKEDSPQLTLKEEKGSQTTNKSIQETYLEENQSKNEKNVSS